MTFLPLAAVAYLIYNEVDKLKVSGTSGKSLFASLIHDITSLFHHTPTPPAATK